MPDFGSPVAQNVNPVGQGVQTLSGLLNIKRQQLGLQGQAAEVQQQQQTASQRAGIAGFMSSFDPTKHVGSDGTLDLDEVLTDPKLRQAAGDQFPALMQQLIGVKQSQLGAKQQLAGLNGTLRDQFSSTVGSLRTDPDVVADNPKGRAKVQQAMGNFAETGGPDAARVASIYGQVINHTPQGKLPQVLSNFQLQAMDAGAQVGLSIPGQDKNAAGQTVNVDKMTGARSMPPGSNDQTNPSSPTVAARTGYNVGTASGDIDRANEVGGLAQSSSATVQLTKRVDQLATEINSGHLAAMVAKGSNYLGFSSVAEARTELQKDLGQLRGAVAGRAGSDSRAAEILEGYPTDTTPENTIHAAMDYIRGSARQALARNNLLAQYKKGDPTNLRGFQAADNALVANTNPLMHEFLALKPEERSGFYRRNFKTPQQAQEFKDSVTALQKHTRLLGGSE